MFSLKLLKFPQKLNNAGYFKRFYTQRNLLALSDRGFFQDMFPDTAG